MPAHSIGFRDPYIRAKNPSPRTCGLNLAAIPNLLFQENLVNLDESFTASA